MSTLTKKGMTAARKKDLWLVVGLAIMALGYILPDVGAMTRMGWKVLCMLIGVIVMISGHGNMLMAAYIACGNLAISGYMTGTEAMNKLLGSSNIVQMFFMIAFCFIVQKTGATDVLGKKIMSIKAVQGKPVLFSAVFLLACGVCAIFVGCTTAVPIYYAIWEGTRNAMGIKAEDKLNKLMLTGVCVSMCIGATMIPFKGLFAVLIAFFESIVASYGYKFDYTLHMALVGVVLVIWCFLHALTIKYVFKADLAPIKTFDISTMEGMRPEDRKFTNRQLVVGGVFLLALAYSVAPTFMPDGDFTTAWKNISLSVVCMVGMAILAIFRCPEDNKPYADLSEALTKGVSWGPYMVAFVLMLISGALTDDTLGIAATMRTALGFMNSINWMAFCFIDLFLTHIITNFFSNSGTFMLMSAVLAPLAIDFSLAHGVNISPLLTGMIILDLAAFWTVSGQPAAAWLFEREGMSAGWVLKNGPVISLILCILVTVVAAIGGFVF